ncbi:MAG: sigma-70 family RNA polymerase sigma factor, partial [Bacteroidales bacterium]|nr:sigma-70 family RNA polymerase sigma factor [Bacteroidales bacterium]
MNSQKAYTELLRRHRTLVWTLCWARARGDYECCRDLVQEVSLSLWEHYGRLRPNATALQ